MDAETERRVARNESLLRDVNEGIEAGRWPGDEGRRLRFRCECASLDCNQTLELTQAEYERLREHPRQFALIASHQLPETEKVIEAHPGYVIVEKRAAAGAMAERLDPRS